jgi:hypothetical protein
MIIPSPRAIGRVAALLLVTTLPLATVACGDEDDTSDASTSGIVGPVVVDVAAANGTTVDVALGRMVDLDVGATDVTGWTAVVADEEVVTFVAGRDDGGSTSDPGLETHSAGSTDVTLTAPDGSIVELRVDVTEK